MKNGKMTRGILRRSWRTIVALGVLLILASSPGWSQSRGQCVRIDAPWPMVLPDGSTHEAGTLNLCFQQMWTPSAGLHEIRVNGASIGLFQSRVGTSEGPVKNAPIVVFQRDGTEEHYLVGYAWPDGESMRTFVLSEFGKAPRRITRNEPLPLFSSENTEVLMAAPPL